MEDAQNILVNVFKYVFTGLQVSFKVSLNLFLRKIKYSKASEKKKEKRQYNTHTLSVMFPVY